jgi:hypothetical protein
MALLDTHLLHFDEAECPFQRTGAGVVVVSFFQQLDLQPRHVYGEQGDVGCVLKGGGVHVPTPHLNSNNRNNRNNVRPFIPTSTGTDQKAGINSTVDRIPSMVIMWSVLERVEYHQHVQQRLQRT